jgi:hypothetical protein
MRETQVFISIWGGLFPFFFAFCGVVMQGGMRVIFLLTGGQKAGRFMSGSIRPGLTNHEKR